MPFKQLTLQEIEDAVRDMPPEQFKLFCQTIIDPLIEEGEPNEEAKE